MQPEQNLYCIMTELLNEMITLSDFYSKFIDKCDLLTRFKIIKNISVAVKKIHDLDLVHLDIKLSNIMINKDDLNIKLLDFGLSCKDLNDKTDLIDKCSNIAGSNFNKAPELYVKSNWKVSKIFFDPNIKRDWKKADIWTIGGIFYRFLKKIYPPVYNDKGNIDLIIGEDPITKNIDYFYNNVKGEIGLDYVDGKLNPEQNKAINNLVESALKKYPTSRPTIDDFVAGIDNVIQLLNS